MGDNQMNGQMNGQNDHNKAGMNIFIVSMVATTVFFLYVSFFSGGVNLKEVKPLDPAATQTVAGGGEAAQKKIDPATLKEPWISTPDVVAVGNDSYQTNCALCHGAGGKGDGPAGMSLNPKPRDLVEGKWKTGGTTLALFDVVTNGLKGTGMAAFGHIPVNERWAIVAYVRSISTNKTADNETELKAKAPTLK